MASASELELLATLDRDAIRRACTDPDSLTELIAEAIDEHLELEELAEGYLACGDHDECALYRQEAAAWRATVVALRAMATGSDHRRTGAA